MKPAGSSEGNHKLGEKVVLRNVVYFLRYSMIFTCFIVFPMIFSLFPLFGARGWPDCWFTFFLVSLSSVNWKLPMW